MKKDSYVDLINTEADTRNKKLWETPEGDSVKEIQEARTKIYNVVRFKEVVGSLALYLSPIIACPVLASLSLFAESPPDPVRIPVAVAAGLVTTTILILATEPFIRRTVKNRQEIVARQEAERLDLLPPQLH